MLLNLKRYNKETVHINGKFINKKFVKDPPGIMNNHNKNGITNSV